MAGIRGKDTKPEKLVRSGLHRLGYRFRLHARELPGKPDLILPRYRAAIFVNGCFWHGHDCHLFRWPSTRQEFWRAKIIGNRERDARNLLALKDSGWRALSIWECALRGRDKIQFENILQDVSGWIDGNSDLEEIRGASTI